MDDLVATFLADPTVGAVGAAIGLAAVALWLAAAWWAHADAIRRTDSALAGYVAAGWVVLSTPLLLPLSLAIYALARPPVPAGDRRVRSLVEALGLTAAGPTCVSCGNSVDAAWLRCPDCTAWLATPCAACGRWSDGLLPVCPWCGDEHRNEPYVEDLVPATADTAAAAAASAGAAASARPTRLVRRSMSPSVPRSQRPGSRRVAVGFDGRRLGRDRIRA